MRNEAARIIAKDFWHVAEDVRVRVKQGRAGEHHFASFVLLTTVHNDMLRP